jgi:hypothetical protein
MGIRILSVRMNEQWQSNFFGTKEDAWPNQ